MTKPQPNCPSLYYFIDRALTATALQLKRDGRALSYTVEYDDGDVEQAVKRGHIAPFPEEVRRGRLGTC